MLRLTVDLPLVIEFFDEPAVAEAIRLIDDLVPGGHIISWPATCHGAACSPAKRG